MDIQHTFVEHLLHTCCSAKSGTCTEMLQTYQWSSLASPLRLASMRTDETPAYLAGECKMAQPCGKQYGGSSSHKQP